MTDLPLKISNVSAKPAVTKPGNSGEAAQQDAQEFGNVLSRQVADSAKPAKAETSAESSAPASDKQTNTGSDKSDAKAGELPADMLAVLLAQQSPSVMPQPDVNTTQLVQAQAAANTAAMPGKDDKPLPALLIGDNGKPANPATPELNAALPQIENTAKSGKTFTDAMSALGMKDANPLAGSQTLRGNVISELPVSSQQPAISPAITLAAASPSNPVSVDTPLNHPAWGDEFSQKITWMSTQRNQSAELHLNPPQLGPLDVVLKMNGDQATAMFTSPHAAVREAIEQALPKLREMLADSGIMLGNAMVSDHSAKNQADNTPRKSQGGSSISAINGASDGATIQEVRVSPISRHHGMVDTFA